MKRCNNNFKPGDIVTYKEDYGSIYMVIKSKKRSILCIGTDSRGLIETNDTDFVTLGDHFGPRECKYLYKRKKVSYEPGSYFDYCYKVIVEKSVRINDRYNKLYMTIVQNENDVWIDPTKNTHEEYYKGFFEKI